MHIVQWLFATTEKFDAVSGEWVVEKEHNYLMSNCFDLHRFFNLFTELRDYDISRNVHPINYNENFSKVYSYENIKYGDLMLLQSILERRAFAGKPYRRKTSDKYWYKRDAGKIHYGKVRDLLEIVANASGTRRCKVNYVCQMLNEVEIKYEPINSFVKEDGRKDV